MYKSPIELFHSDMQIQIEGEIMRSAQNIGIIVDKEELLKALKYDREQYYRGYNDAVDEFVDRLGSYLDELDCEAFISDMRHIADCMKV